MTHPTPLLSLQHLERAFETPAGPVHVLNHVELDVFPGDFVALTGPSGSGKTTLLNIASLLDHPTGGHVIFDGLDISKLSAQELAQLRREKMGMVFQRFHLLTRRTTIDNVIFRFRYTTEPRKRARELARQALQTVGLKELAMRQARLLSGGEMQRVAIARAIAKPPMLLLADEPTGNLDRDAAATVMNLFRKINKMGVAIILATHNQSLLHYCTRHIVCQNGTTVERTPPHDD